MCFQGILLELEDEEDAEARAAAEEEAYAQSWTVRMSALLAEKEAVKMNAAVPEPEPEPEPLVLPRYKALAGSGIRAAIAMDSDNVGNLVVGEEIVALASETVGDTLRIQFERGWVSVFAKSGKAVLEIVTSDAGKPEEEEDDTDDDSESDENESDDGSDGKYTNNPHHILIYVWRCI